MNGPNGLGVEKLRIFPQRSDYFYKLDTQDRVARKFDCTNGRSVKSSAC
jgi:hypothetical protein